MNSMRRRAMGSDGSPAEVRADLNRLQEQLHELHQRIVDSADQSRDASNEGHNVAMVIRGR